MATITTTGICPYCRGEMVRVRRLLRSRHADHLPVDRLACPRCDYDLWQPCAVDGCAMRVPPGQRLCTKCRDEWDALCAPTVSGGLTLRGEDEPSLYRRITDWLFCPATSARFCWLMVALAAMVILYQAVR